MSQASIADKLRLIPRDYGETFQFRVTGDGTTSKYDLPRDNVGIDVVYVEGTPPVTLTPAASLGAIGPGQYYVDGRMGAIYLSSALANNATLVVNGKVYAFLLPADVTTYVDIAFQLHVHGRTPEPSYDTLPPFEEYLVALLAALEALWGAVAEASMEIDILTPEGVQIPRSQRFAQLMSLIQQIERHYKELAAAFNVGPFRIVVQNLRRVSRTTNRLVPEYMEQEFDDRTYPPVRIYPPIESGQV